MKLIVFLLLLIPIASVLRYVLLDVLNDLVVSQKKQRISRTRTKPVATSNDTYVYKKAQ